MSNNLISEDTPINLNILKIDNILGFCTVRSISVSPQKMNLILDSIRGKSVVIAKSILLFHVKRAAPVVLNALKNAVSMAEKEGFSENELQIDSVYSGLQRIIKQVIPQGRGKRGVRKRRSCFIYISVKKKVLKNDIKNKNKEVFHGK